MFYNGEPAFISFVQKGSDFNLNFDQINFVVPDTDALGPVTIEVETAGGRSAPVMVMNQALSPTLFSPSVPSTESPRRWRRCISMGRWSDLRTYLLRALTFGLPNQEISSCCSAWVLGRPASRAGRDPAGPGASPRLFPDGRRRQNLLRRCRSRAQLRGPFEQCGPLPDQCHRPRRAARRRARGSQSRRPAITRRYLAPSRHRKGNPKRLCGLRCRSPTFQTGSTPVTGVTSPCRTETQLVRMD